MRIDVIDLFAGAGGLSEGLRTSGKEYNFVSAVESDIDAALTYSQNFPSSNVVFSPIEDWATTGKIPPSDLIVGGPPCQGFSTLGKQDVDDEKNRLWEIYAEIVSVSSPQYFVMENVPQFATSPQREVFERSLVDGVLNNYSATVYLVNSADYGSPQNRRRMIILGSRKDVRTLSMPPALTFEYTSKTVKDAFRGLPEKVEETALPERFVDHKGKKRPGPFTTSELHVTRSYQPISRARFASIPPGGNRFDLPEELLSPCWRKHKSGSGDVMGRLHWDRPSVTIRTEFNKPEKGRYLHPTENRAITHHEAARLMGFPDDYKWVGSKTSIAKQIGNAVPIELGAAIGKQILHLMTHA